LEIKIKKPLICSTSRILLHIHRQNKHDHGNIGVCEERLQLPIDGIRRIVYGKKSLLTSISIYILNGWKRELLITACE